MTRTPAAAGKTGDTKTKPAAAKPSGPVDATGSSTASSSSTDGTETVQTKFDGGADGGPAAAVIVTVTDPAPAPVSPEPGDEVVTGQAKRCVVRDGTPHMGRPVHGKVCSAHEMHYLSDGSPRVPLSRRGAK